MRILQSSLTIDTQYPVMSTGALDFALCANNNPEEEMTIRSAGAMRLIVYFIESPLNDGCAHFLRLRAVALALRARLHYLRLRPTGLALHRAPLMRDETTRRS